MEYRQKYKTPDNFSDIILSSDGKFLTGLWFENSPDADKHISTCYTKQLPIFDKTFRWLDIYFSGHVPDFVPAYKLPALTDFRRDVFEIMKNIPFGQTITYGNIADCIAKKRNIMHISSQAVGGAVGWNPICIIIPCHRVMGGDGKITGYGGGIENKQALLKNEGIIL